MELEFVVNQKKITVNLVLLALETDIEDNISHNKTVNSAPEKFSVVRKKTEKILSFQWGKPQPLCQRDSSQFRGFGVTTNSKGHKLKSKSKLTQFSLYIIHKNET